MKTGDTKRITEENPTDLMLEIQNSVSQIKASAEGFRHRTDHAGNRIRQEDEVDESDQPARSESFG